MIENAKILIAEDEKPMRDALKKKLTDEGFTVLEAKNGKEGLDIALKEHPDLILADIVMPIMDGVNMIKEIRKDSWGAGAKVIILSNLSDNEKVSEALGQGTHGYLIKTDWKLDDIVKTIKEKLAE